MDNGLTILVVSVVAGGLGGWVGYRLKSEFMTNKPDQAQIAYENLARQINVEGMLGIHDLDLFPHHGDEATDVPSLISSQANMLKRTREARKAYREEFASRWS